MYLPYIRALGYFVQSTLNATIMFEIKNISNTDIPEFIKVLCEMNIEHCLSYPVDELFSLERTSYE